MAYQQGYSMRGGGGGSSRSSRPTTVQRNLPGNGALFQFGGKGSWLADLGLSLIPGIGSAIEANRLDRIDQRNFEMQGEWLDYQKALQKNIFEREDTAVQRRVEDLRNAGMAPFMAAGQGANAGGAVQTAAPQRGLKGKLAKLDMLNNFAGRMLDVKRMGAELEAVRAQTKRTNVETDQLRQSWQERRAMLQEELTQKILTNRVYRETLQSKIKAEKAIAESEWFKASMTAMDWGIYNQYKNWLKNQKFEDGGLSHNPKIAEWQVLKIMHDLKKYDRDFYEDLSEGKVDLSSGAGLNALFQILRTLK